MNTKTLVRRVARLEQNARTAYAAWLETLTDAELDELCTAIPADERAALDTLTDDELERLVAGCMSNDVVKAMP